MERSLLDLDTFCLGNRAEMSGDLPGGDAAKIEALTARENGVGNRLHLRGSEDENHVLRRLLQRLQQRIECRGREHVDFVDDVDLIDALGRGVAHDFAQLADVIDAVVGGSVDLQHVHAGRGGDALAGIACLAGIAVAGVGAVENLGENPRGRGLAYAAGAAKQVALRDAAGMDGIL